MPGPSKMLYDYDPTIPGFQAFKTSKFTISVCQPGSPFSNLFPLTPDAIPPYGSLILPASFRLKFTNTGTLPYHLSDWVFVYGT